MPRGRGKKRLVGLVVAGGVVVAVVAPFLWWLEAGDRVHEGAGELAIECPDVGPERREDCGAADGPVAALIRAFHQPGDRWDERLQSALHRVAAAEPGELDAVERILGQNTALHAAFRFDPSRTWKGAERRNRTRRARQAWSVVRHLALSATELNELGSEPDPAIELWLGNRDHWEERRAEMPTLHASMMSLARVFRPIALRDGFAILSQLVAVDTEGRPYITPVVGEIEIRGRATACVAKLDLAWVRCGAPLGLRPVTWDDLDRGRIQPSIFVQRGARGSLACNSCHGAGPITQPLPPADAASHVAERHARHLEDVASRIQRLRHALEKEL